MAILGQVVGAVTLPEMAEAAPLGVICGVDRPLPGHTPAHHHHDCAICPLCAAAAVHAALVTPGPVLRPPVAVDIAVPGLPPPARAPPSWQYGTPFPRGPPSA